MIYIGACMQVSKWGNSLGVRLPKTLVEKLGLKAGDELTVVEAEERRITVEKCDRRKAALARMAARKWLRPKGYRFDRDEANKR